MTYQRIAAFSIALALLVAGTPALAATSATGAFDAGTLTTSVTKPTITGTVLGAKTARVVIEDGKGKSVSKSGTLKIKNGTWSYKVSKSLKAGDYSVSLYAPKLGNRYLIATSTLTVLPKGSAGSASGGTLSASMLPLLFGGNAVHGASVPVAYVKITDTGTASSSISGITLSENGSAPDDVVIGFSTNDDKGGSRTTVGGAEGTLEFKNGTAFVPLAATIGPKQFRIYTIKAILSNMSGISYGKKLMINVASIGTSAKVSGTFPLVGTTWTLVY